MPKPPEPPDLKHCSDCGKVIGPHRAGSVLSASAGSRQWTRYVALMGRERGLIDDPSTGLTVGTASSCQAFIATMKNRETRERLLEDRKMLLKTLRDHDAGKLDHLGQRERDHFVENVKTRIMELSERIACLDSKL